MDPSPGGALGKVRLPWLSQPLLHPWPARERTPSGGRLKELYDKILADKGSGGLACDTMLLRLTHHDRRAGERAHQNVQNIVNEYRDIVVQ